MEKVNLKRLGFGKVLAMSALPMPVPLAWAARTQSEARKKAL